ncbi:MAG: hypothetical protein SPI74_00610 [Eubacterium sp.]|nr:hypothetical protein [Eubacterium sp.]
MVILVGNKYRLGAMADVITKRLGEELIYLDENISIKAQENDILACGKADFIIYDMDQYFNEAEELIDVIKRIQRVNSAKPILYVATDNPKSELIKVAVAASIKGFINESRGLGEQKDQLEKIINGFYEVYEREDIVAAEREIEKEHKTLNAFVGELYDAKQREIEKEHTIIVNKKGELEVVFETAKIILKFIFAVITIALITIALITLVYTDTRMALFKVLDNIFNEMLSMIR